MKSDIESYFIGTPQQQQEQQHDILVDLGFIEPLTRTVQHTQVKQPNKDGKGLNNANISTGSGFIASPNNIVDYVSRLEVLIGGKRAGNNSPEIINEAADISQRLFQRGIMDMNIYRGLIDELTDGYYSD